MSRPVALVAGPTASGKSGLALALAEAFNGVVINADSMQVYRELAILTARPEAAALAAAPHRLYGVLSVRDACSAGRWREMALAEIGAAHDAGKLPILAGGTGLYLKALVEGLATLPKVFQWFNSLDRQPALSCEKLRARVCVGVCLAQEIATGTVVALDPFPVSSAQWLNAVCNADKFALDGGAILLQFVDQLGSCPVDHDLSRTGLPFDGVGLETGGVVDVRYEDLLPGPYVGRAQQVLVDDDTTDIVGVRLGDSRAVDLTPH